MQKAFWSNIRGSRYRHEGHARMGARVWRRKWKTLRPRPLSWPVVPGAMVEALEALGTTWLTHLLFARRWYYKFVMNVSF